MPVCKVYACYAIKITTQTRIRTHKNTDGRPGSLVSDSLCFYKAQQITITYGM